jgi:hypothetical protein
MWLGKSGPKIRLINRGDFKSNFPSFIIHYCIKFRVIDISLCNPFFIDFSIRNFLSRTVFFFQKFPKKIVFIWKKYRKFSLTKKSTFLEFFYFFLNHFPKYQIFRHFKIYRKIQIFYLFKFSSYINTNFSHIFFLFLAFLWIFTPNKKLIELIN